MNAHDPTDSFDPSDPDATGPQYPAAPGHRGSRDGDVIAGRYTLGERIGEGGMGSVYLATQTEPVRRQVALKLIKAGMDSRAVLARFDAERQALALMDHPNIAKVYDGGTTPSGQPFFVMELVQGLPLTQFCDDRRMTVPARLELFVAVCRAVQHAHQKGIIHRDLKPSNVLVTEVDGRPTPKVIDFGVAKATEQKLTDLSFADTGAVVGTPAYMSPEQADPASMDIDTRTDVYALGVMLYELLAGSPPIDAKQFKRGAVLEMLRMVREVDPPRPSTKLSTAEALPSIAANRGEEPARLTQLLRGELDWVVMKAIEKDRARRYESASGLARDLERYLADEVVEARPPSAGYRLRKFVRRHRGQVIAAGLVFFALVAGIVGTTLGLLRAEEQRGVAQSRLDQLTVANAQTETEKTRAEQNFATARMLVFDLGLRIGQIETGQADPKLADRARLEAMDAARAQFDKFREAHPDDAGLKAQAAKLHRFAANVARLLSDHPAALAAYAAAVTILEGLIEQVPNEPEYRDDLALTLADRGTTERTMGKLKEADATLARAAAIADGAQGTLPETSRRRTMAVILNDRTEVAFRAGRFDDALRYATAAAAGFDQLQAAPAGERISYDALYAAMAVHRSALAERERGRTAEALLQHDAAAERMKKILGPQANRDERYWDGEIRRERARTAAAVPDRRAAAAADLAALAPAAEKLMDENPNLYFYRSGLAATLLYRGELLLALGQPEPATADLTKSLAVSRELVDKFGVLTESMLVRGQTFLALGRARAAAGKADEAAGHFKNAARVFEIALKVDPDNVHHRRGLAAAGRGAAP